MDASPSSREALRPVQSPLPEGLPQASYSSPAHSHFTENDNNENNYNNGCLWRPYLCQAPSLLMSSLSVLLHVPQENTLNHPHFQLAPWGSEDHACTTLADC